MVQSPASHRLFPIPAVGKRKDLLSGTPTSGVQEALPRPLPTRQSSSRKTGGEPGAPPPFSLFPWLSSPRSRRRPLSSKTNSGPSPCPALTHVLLERVSGEKRHPAVVRALIAVVWPWQGGYSWLGDPRPPLPRRLGSDRVLALPPQHLPASRLTGQLRIRTPPPRSGLTLFPGRVAASVRILSALLSPPPPWKRPQPLSQASLGGQAAAAATFPSLGPRQATEQGTFGAGSCRA